MENRERTGGNRDPRPGLPSAEERKKTDKHYEKDTKPTGEGEFVKGTDPRVIEQFGQEIGFLFPQRG